MLKVLTFGTKISIIYAIRNSYGRLIMNKLNKKLKIYLSGKMGGLTFEEYTEWRDKIALLLAKFGEKVEIFDPSRHYNYEINAHYTEKEVMRYELRHVESSDLVILNLENADTSVGTIFEIAYAFKNNIPILGLCNLEKFTANPECTIHPWLIEACDRLEFNEKNLIKYIKEHYID